MKKDNALLWFRNDLRLTDNSAFLEALSTHTHVFPIYIHSTEEEGSWKAGAASSWWLHYSLKELNDSLHKLKFELIIQKGSTTKILNQLTKDLSINSIFFNRRSEPWARQQEEKICREFQSTKIEINIYNSNWLIAPEHLSTKSNTAFKVFTPFWHALAALPEPQTASFKPHSIQSIIKKSPINNLSVEDLELLPKIDWAGGIKEAWQPGEASAKKILQKFLDNGLPNYSKGRDRPALSFVSRLSPHLHFGEISPQTVWHAVRKRCQENRALSSEGHTFLRELGWREFANYLLYHFPATTDKPLRPEFNKFPWSKNKKFLRAWQHGKTGYPIVDAGMRELWHTGWMHNRVRMIVASFLVKDLLIPWQEGAKWFWDTLVDADLANNTLGWQWTAGCGADAAPYFRIFNPVLQGEKFDPEGEYVKQWIPELKKIPSKWIHQPWLAPKEELAKAGVNLGINYPKPIVDHKIARQRALSAFNNLKQTD